MVSISLCLVIQNEEDCIIDSLDNCVKYVDEIILLDGGSTDRTKELVADYPLVKLYEHPFDNFHWQKNRCIAYASCEWILFKDADELFEGDVLDGLQRLVTDYTEHDAFAFPRKTYIDGYLINVLDHDYKIRFWKTGKGIHFESSVEDKYKIHPDAVGFKSVCRTNVWILHNKTAAMQQEDNELYWNMGQEAAPGWTKTESGWTYNKSQNTGN